MSELKVSSASLDRAIANVNEASGLASDMNVSDGLEGVASAMPGGAAGSSASAAGTHVDDVAAKLATGLSEYASALSGAQSAYNTMDESASVDFGAFDAALEGQG